MRDMREEVIAFLNDLDNTEMVRIHNQYCDEAGYGDDEIFNMYDINEFLDGKDPDEILRMAFYGDFRPCDEYFRFNGYGNLVSTDYPGKDWIDIDDIADYIVENEEDFDNDDLRDLMDEIEAENEEEEEEEEEE